MGQRWDRGGTKVGAELERKRGYKENMTNNAIIRLVCIERYTGFKYKRLGQQGIRVEWIQSLGRSRGLEKTGGAQSSGG